MLRGISAWVISAICLVAAVGCGSGRNGAASVAGRADCNGVYYWKTVFSLDSTDTAFLERYDIGRLYVRFFDVDYDGTVVPMASTRFQSAKPEGVEIVPAVFITVPAIRAMKDEKELADHIVTRVLNMADYHDLGPVREMQLDCDWTETTRDAYYRLCAAVHDILAPQGILLSSTIRLHQLSQAVPPVDCGVLMLYNTGAIPLPQTKNSILDEADVKSYLKGRPVAYDLPLDFAYPVYGWGVLFRGGEYVGILHETDFSDEALYQREENGYYSVVSAHILEGRALVPGDRIRLEFPSAGTIGLVQDLVDAAFPSAPHSTILYHLDSSNLSHYTDDEIHAIYSR